MDTHLLPPQVSAPIPENNQEISHSLDGAGLGVFRYLALCLTTVGWLAITPSPGQATASQIEAEAALHLVCTRETDQFICNPAANSPASAAEESRVTATIVPQFFTPTAQANIANALLGVTYLLPIGLSLGIFLYDRYAHYRASLLQRQINALEQIWQRHTTH